MSESSKQDMIQHWEDHGIPPNPYNPHCWITGKPDVGEGTWIGAFSLIDGLGGLKIGRYCDIASGSQILSHSTVRRCLTERRWNEIDYMPTTIEDHVFVGAHAVILMGCHIGHHSVIAAGAVYLRVLAYRPILWLRGSRQE